jgi:phage shock protein A
MTMDIEQMGQALESMQAQVADMNKQMSVHLLNLDKLLKAIEATDTMRKQLVSVNAIEEQTVSVVRRLADKWRENTDEVTRMREKIDRFEGDVVMMGKHFHILSDRLNDVIDCPFPGILERMKGLKEQLPPDAPTCHGNP